MQRDLGIGRVNAFRFLSRLPITGIDQALVRGREGCVIKRKGEEHLRWRESVWKGGRVRGRGCQREGDGGEGRSVLEGGMIISYVLYE